MKLLLINVVCGVKSTGRICTDIAEYMNAEGHEVRIAYGRENVPEEYQKYAVKIGNNMDVLKHGIKKLILDGEGLGSKRATRKFIEWVRKYDPDVIHLHNIAGYYINIPILFEYLKMSGKKIIWTMHDCSAFTGGCPYFELAGCYRWKNKCGKCPMRGMFPRRKWIDRSEHNLMENKKLYGSLENLTIISPSEWLKNYIINSFLGKYHIHVIHNGVDTSVFCDRGDSLKERLGLKGIHIVLGVASPWSDRKGLRDFIKISEMLPTGYCIVLIGLSQKQIKNLPERIIGIQRTDSAVELAEYYSMANVYVNPTYEDNYPTTNLESIACGTPVITYDTGGSGESARMFGKVVKKGDINGLVSTIKDIVNTDYIFQKHNKGITIDNKETMKKYYKFYI